MAATSRRSFLYSITSLAAVAGMLAITSGKIPLAAQDRLSVATLDELKDVHPEIHPFVFVEETGRNGTFVWQAGDYRRDVQADVLEGIFVASRQDPRGSSGSWVRRVEGPVDIRWFGATTERDCLAAFNAALAAVRERGGGTIVFPAEETGGWTLSDTAVIDTDNVRIELF